MNVAVAFEDVIGRLRTGVGDAKPIEVGLSLFTLLTSQHRVTVLARQDGEAVTRWLKQYAPHARYIGIRASSPDHVHQQMSLVEHREHQLRQTRPDLLVEASPSVCAAAMRLGIAVFLFSHPAYARMEYSPSNPGMREWAEIEAEIVEQETLRGKQEESAWRSDV